MGYRVIRSGTTIECDSAQDVLQLTRLLDGEAPTPAPAAKAPPQASHAAAKNGVAELLAQLKENQRRFLLTLRDRGTMSLEDIRQSLDLPGPHQISGVLGGIQKNLKRLKIKPEAVVVREQTGSARNTVVTYRPGPMLREFKEVSG